MMDTGSYSDERVMRRRDGTLFWCHVVGRALDRAQPFARAVWMFEDISHRRVVSTPLTVREREVAQHIVTGATSKQIARHLHISHRTVEAHRGGSCASWGPPARANWWPCCWACPDPGTIGARTPSLPTCRPPCPASCPRPGPFPARGLGRPGASDLHRLPGGIFARPIGFLSAFWPANALLLGLLVRYPHLARPPAWVAAAVGYVAADLATGSAWGMALWLNAANLLGATAGWLVLRGLDEPILRLQRTVAALYLLLAALVASAVGALAGCGAAPVYFDSPWTDLLSLWFSTELMNYMLIVPVVLAAPRAADPPSHTPDTPLFWRVAPVSSLVLAEGIRTLIGGPGMLAFVVPGLLWCALSYSAFTSSLLSLVVCLWTMAGVATGVLNFTPAHAGDVFSLRVGVTLLALGPLAVACASAARAEALRRLHHAVRHDDLTGVLARRALLKQGDRLLERYQRESTGLAVMMVDVDHFKQVNDQHGHGAGDRLLVQHCPDHAARAARRRRAGPHGG